MAFFVHVLHSLFHKRYRPCNIVVLLNRVLFKPCFGCHSTNSLTGYNGKCSDTSAGLPGGPGAAAFDILVERAQAEFTIKMHLRCTVCVSVSTVSTYTAYRLFPTRAQGGLGRRGLSEV